MSTFLSIQTNVDIEVFLVGWLISHVGNGNHSLFTPVSFLVLQWKNRNERLCALVNYAFDLYCSSWLLVYESFQGVRDGRKVDLKLAAECVSRTVASKYRTMQGRRLLFFKPLFIHIFLSCFDCRPPAQQPPFVVALVMHSWRVMKGRLIQKSHTLKIHSDPMNRSRIRETPSMVFHNRTAGRK